MILEIGKIYKRKNGDMIRICRYNEALQYPYVGYRVGKGWGLGEPAFSCYNENGKFFSEESELDLTLPAFSSDEASDPQT